MQQLDPNKIETRDLVSPYYYAWYRSNETSLLLRQKGYYITTDDVRLIFLRLQRSLIQKYDRSRILDIALQELKQDTTYNNSYIAFDKNSYTPINK